MLFKDFIPKPRMVAIASIRMMVIGAVGDLSPKDI